MACGSWVVSFLGKFFFSFEFNFLSFEGLWRLHEDLLVTEGYCWTRTGERQATRMRARYLKAVLRQDVGYFDLQVSSTAEVVTSVSNDSLVIQDVIGEKVPF